MSDLTKEWLQQTISELEEERDATPGAVNVDAAMAMAAMKRALASLEAEPVAEVCEGFTLRYIGYGPAPKSGVHIGDRLFTAPPAPVFVPDLKPVGFLFVSDDGAVAYSPADWPMKGFNLIGQIYGDLNAYRAAMLHGAEPVTTAYKLPEGWVAVPVEPTEEMIAAAMCSNDVLFDKEDDTLFRVQHGEIWRAMLSTAPQQEVKP